MKKINIIYLTLLLLATATTAKSQVYVDLISTQRTYGYTIEDQEPEITARIYTEIPIVIDVENGELYISKKLAVYNMRHIDVPENIGKSVAWIGSDIDTKGEVVVLLSNKGGSKYLVLRWENGDMIMHKVKQ